ncbi:Thaumatin domain-containing protein [Legionella steigerwaltii]|uniref:Thaumatin domain-containing protein n=1 Tax=Legionella steigerwaltii TaxID=460 RepID=A0A378LC90_9GAMM|nr:arylsulfotransferase family protein [Legionella steigerwaltii]KTD77794.1 Thaumatin domain-containing protein [Legionella steigerwaltii]STY24433.1 Thaumatin domain-containing protein [Legionella steigerwaltii]
MKYFWGAVFFTLTLKSALADNPIDITLAPQFGLPTTTFVDNSYVAEYTFTNNLPFPKQIYLQPSIIGSGFDYDGFCNEITLAPKGKKGSSCTTYIKFQPTSNGVSKFELTLQYDKNVIHLRPLSTSSAQLCGTTAYPSNTGSVVPEPTIISNQVWSFLSSPQLHPMKVSIAPYTASQLASGLILNAPYAFSDESTYGQTGALITDNDGNPIWFRPLSNVSLMNADFKVQLFNGNPVLTFWQGTIATPPAYTNLPAGGAEPGACFYILDNHYNVIKTISALNGFTSDEHEFLITPQNTVLFFGTKVVPMDLTPYGGPQQGAIHDFSIQEIDLATNKLIFFWDALDHIPLTSTHMPASSATESSSVWDPYHLNSLGLISGSNDILFSSRNTWTIYRLNKSTGNFVWQLAGDGTGDFSIPNTQGLFSWQHDARLLPGNIISMFDDNCCESDTVPPGTIPSHGLILSLDLTGKVANFQSSYYLNPNVNSSSQGNTQNLANGNKFLGFGSNGYFAEYAAQGNTESTSWVNVFYSAQMPSDNISYRSYRNTWIGRPDYPPSITVGTANNQTTVYASWNGATEVAGWQVYAGNQPNILDLISSANKNGFETAINVGSGWTFFQVKAVDSKGQVIGVSTIVKA